MILGAQKTKANSKISITDSSMKKGEKSVICNPQGTHDWSERDMAVSHWFGAINPT